jgi:hypothetical protein
MSGRLVFAQVVTEAPLGLFKLPGVEFAVQFEHSVHSLVPTVAVKRERGYYDSGNNRCSLNGSGYRAVLTRCQCSYGDYKSAQDNGDENASEEIGGTP